MDDAVGRVGPITWFWETLLWVYMTREDRRERGRRECGFFTTSWLIGSQMLNTISRILQGMLRGCDSSY